MQNAQLMQEESNNGLSTATANDTTTPEPTINSTPSMTSSPTDSPMTNPTDALAVSPTPTGTSMAIRRRTRLRKESSHSEVISDTTAHQVHRGLDGIASGTTTNTHLC